MRQSTKILLFALIVVVVACALIEAKSANPEEAEEFASNHLRERRNAQGAVQSLMEKFKEVGGKASGKIKQFVGGLRGRGSS